MMPGYVILRGVEEDRQNELEEEEEEGDERRVRLGMPVVVVAVVAKSKGRTRQHQTDGRSYGGSTADGGRPKPSIYMGGEE